jgi:multiple sugar transport system ATP-binding protein
METRTEIAKLHRDLAATMIYVTHDQVEAMTLADKIVVLNGGVVQQVGAPMDLYRNPCNAFVAGFLGSPKMNLLTVDVTAVQDGRAHIDFPGLTGLSVAAGRVVAPGKALFGVRPQMLSLNPGDHQLTGRVTLVERMGPETVVSLMLPDGAALLAVLPGDVQLALESDVTLSFVESDVRLFPASDLNN